MKIEFEDNEFTTQELLNFLTSAYGSQINGKPFTAATVRNWIEIKHFPVAYGGYKIISNILYNQYGNMRVLTMDGLTRKEVTEMVGSMYNTKKIERVEKNKRPRKQRTKLYYQILQSASKQYTKKTLTQSTLPLYWKEAGIKKNQLVNRSKSSK